MLLSPDYSTDGVWHQDGDPGDADELPVSKVLVARICAWQGWFELFELGREESYKRWDLEGFVKRGLEIAQAIKAELPDFTVWYSDYQTKTRVAIRNR